jgi:acyl carrier protein
LVALGREEAPLDGIRNEKGEGEGSMQRAAVTAMMLDDDALTAQEFELAQLIVTALNLDIRAEEVKPTTPLYGEGLGLDSIDILEVALAISKTYGVRLRSDDANNQQIFSSLRSLNRHIRQHRP